MTNATQEVINKMDEETLRKTISIHFDKKDIVELCELRLAHLNVDAAMVEQTDLSDFANI